MIEREKLTFTSSGERLLDRCRYIVVLIFLLAALLALSFIDARTLLHCPRHDRLCGGERRC